METTALTAAGGLVLGLSTGVGCLGWCLPALGPFVAAQCSSARRGLRDVLWFNLGRLAGYLVVFAAASIGGRVAATEAAWLRPLSAVALVVLGVLVLLYAARVNFPTAKLCRNEALLCLLGRFPVGAGLLIGLSPCPPLLLAAAAVVGGATGPALLFGG